MLLLSEGTIFGLISGCLTATGLILSNLGANTSVKFMVMVLVSIAFSDSFSEGLGMYYSSYKDDKDIVKSIKEAIKTFLGKFIIPLLMVLVFLAVKNVDKASWFILGFVFTVFMLINIYVFTDVAVQVKYANIVVFILVVAINYFVGSKFK